MGKGRDMACCGGWRRSLVSASRAIGEGPTLTFLGEGRNSLMTLYAKAKDSTGIEMFDERGALRVAIAAGSGGDGTLLVLGKDGMLAFPEKK